MPYPFPIIIIISGLLLGSFFNSVIYKIPRGQKIFMLGAFCSRCLNPISLYMNLPFISKISVWKECRNCHISIGYFPLFVEIFTAVLLYFSVLEWNPMIAGSISQGIWNTGFILFINSNTLLFL